MRARARARVCVYVRVHAGVFVCVYVRAPACLCLCVCARARVCVCVRAPVYPSAPAQFIRFFPYISLLRSDDKNTALTQLCPKRSPRLTRLAVLLVLMQAVSVNKPVSSGSPKALSHLTPKTVASIVKGEEGFHQTLFFLTDMPSTTA